MAKMRDAIRMSETEIVTLLEECKSLQLATLDKDGAPHLTTVWFAYQEVQQVKRFGCKRNFVAGPS